MRRKVSIVHWSPVDIYPPVINLARHLAGTGRWDVSLHTTKNRHRRADFQHEGITVHRAPNPSSEGAAMRSAAYLSFHLHTAGRLISERPDVVVYVEPQSSFPVLLARKLGGRFPVFVHHHEYHEPSEFLLSGMRLARVFHALEKRLLFPVAEWISHTNPERLELFLRDNPAVSHSVARVLPNLPPASWAPLAGNAWTALPPPPLRMVYVGSLSLRDTYIAEVVSWVQSQNPGAVTLDIYSYNVDHDTRDWLGKVEGNGVRFIPRGVEYDELPRTLGHYHTGLILYQANSLNYRHNASNKLFEYLACGLDVVFPSRMLGVKPYARFDRQPRVLEVDFETGEGLDLARLSDRGSLPVAAPTGSAEDALADLESAMTKAVENRSREQRGGVPDK